MLYWTKFPTGVFVLVVIAAAVAAAIPTSASAAWGVLIAGVRSHWPLRVIFILVPSLCVTEKLDYRCVLMLGPQQNINELPAKPVYFCLRLEQALPFQLSL